jgi:hypothetical protein
MILGMALIVASQATQSAQCVAEVRPSAQSSNTITRLQLVWRGPSHNASGPWLLLDCVGVPK